MTNVICITHGIHVYISTCKCNSSGFQVAKSIWQMSTVLHVVYMCTFPLASVIRVVFRWQNPYDVIKEQRACGKQVYNVICIPRGKQVDLSSVFQLYSTCITHVYHVVYGRKTTWNTAGFVHVEYRWVHMYTSCIPHDIATRDMHVGSIRV